MHRKKKGTNKIKLNIIEQGRKKCREKGKAKQGNAEKQKGKKEEEGKTEGIFSQREVAFE